MALRVFISLVLVAVLQSTGCGSPRYVLVPPGRPTSAVNTPPQFVDDGGALLIADGQLNQLVGPVDPIYRNQLFARFLPRVVRSVPLELYAPELLRWTVDRQTTARRLVIHLGDALNTACVSEFERFVDIMGAAKGGWVMAPGNHDFYYNGHRHPVGTDDTSWRQACWPSAPLSKSQFIKRYLAALQQQAAPIVPRLAANAKQGEWHAEHANGKLKAIAWKIASERPWNSYLVQRVELPIRNNGKPLQLILLDTTQYRKDGSMPLTGGGFGDLQRDQQRIVSRWIEAARKDGSPVVLVGHHPYGMLRLRARSSLNRLRMQGSVELYISAHRHRGEYIRHGSWVEMNLGSITDGPAEFRLLQPSHEQRGHETGSGGLMLNSALVRLVDEIAPGKRCEAHWKDPQLYRAHYTEPLPRILDLPYKEAYALLTQRLVLRTLRQEMLQFPSRAPDDRLADRAELRSISRGIECSPRTALEARELSRKRQTLIRHVARYLADKNPTNESAAKRLRDYKLCQAHWASTQGRDDRVADNWRNSVYFPDEQPHEK